MEFTSFVRIGWTFSGDYEPMASTPTRVIRPESNSHFTCFVLSRDGERLAAGEMNGRVRFDATSHLSIRLHC